MKLPYVERALVPDTKLGAYLLSLSSAGGKDKAAFFLRFGFSRSRPEEFRTALLAHGEQHDVASTRVNVQGTKYIVEGELISPDGRNPLVRSVWIILNEENTPRFVTAYRLRRRRP
jgi:hypothetical protein